MLSAVALQVNADTQPYVLGNMVLDVNFETGNNSQLNGQLQNTCTSGAVAVSSTNVHSGGYAGYYSGQGNATSTSKSCREYNMLNLNMKPYAAVGPMTNFYFKMWVYIPKVTIPSWISFATFGSGDGLPFTVDGNNHNQIQLFVSIVGNKVFTQNLVSPAVVFPFDRWFSISLVARNVGGQTSQITIYQDDVPIINYQGLLLANPMAYAHFGLYMSNKQPSLTLYNDDVQFYNIV